MRMSDSLCTLAAIYNKHIKFNGVSHRNVIDDGGDKQHRKQKLCPATLICLCENSPRCHSCVPKCELASRNDRLIQSPAKDVKDPDGADIKMSERKASPCEHVRAHQNRFILRKGPPVFMVESRGTWNLLNQGNGWENAPQQPFIGYKRIQTCCVMQHRFKATVGLQSSRSLSRLLASN